MDCKEKFEMPCLKCKKMFNYQPSFDSHVENVQVLHFKIIVQNVTNSSTMNPTMIVM